MALGACQDAAELGLDPVDLSTRILLTDRSARVQKMATAQVHRFMPDPRAVRALRQARDSDPDPLTRDWARRILEWEAQAGRIEVAAWPGCNDIAEPGGPPRPVYAWSSRSLRRADMSSRCASVGVRWL